jgi:hypothetical protein
MNRLWPRTQQEQIDYHLRRNDTPNFSEGQPGRIDIARFLVDKIIKKDIGATLTDRPLKFVELGCGSGDITGPYSQPIWVGDRKILSGDVEVYGYDVVPQAAVSVGARFPNMHIEIGPVEEVEPFECDLLVMCEFLEHVNDPWSIVNAWMPKAHFAIIGHPLDEPSPPYETGHIWSYNLGDWQAWFEATGHHVWERFLFPMGYYDNMVIGHGSRKDLPPFAG